MAFLLKTKGLDKFFAKMRSTFFSLDRQVLTEIGQFSADRIQQFTRIGKSIASDEPQALKPLSKSYKDFRRGKVTFWKSGKGVTIAAKFRSNKLNSVDTSFFKPVKSNLTFTGQLLKSIDFKVDTARNSVLIKPTGARNLKVAGFVSRERPFMGMDRVGRERINNFVKRAIRERLNRK